MRKNIPHTDLEYVKSFYQKDNYCIEYSEDCLTKEYCAIYFSSHNIYYPNTYETFKKRIVEGDFYEWHNIKIQKAYKHIFLRDIFKQWYLKGINNQINSPEKLLDFLQQETRGYKIITLGSSAGGYGALLYGSLLNAERILAFNAQFEINSLLKFSTEYFNPFIFRFKHLSISKYFDIRSYINKNSDIFYFYSKKSTWDFEQYSLISHIPIIHKIGFLTSHHGIPVLKNNLEKILDMDREKLISLAQNSPYNVLLFSIKLVGLKKTLSCWLSQNYRRFNKQIYRKIHLINKKLKKGAIPGIAILSLSGYEMDTISNVHVTITPPQTPVPHYKIAEKLISKHHSYNRKLLKTINNYQDKCYRTYE